LPVLPAGVQSTAEKAFYALFDFLSGLILPEDCRVCGEKLCKTTRIPVCDRCIHAPEPIAAEFYCVACRTPFLNRSPLDESGRCALCRLGASGFDAVYTFGSYEGVLRKLIHLLKYQRIRSLSRVLGDYLRRALPIEQRFDVIVPIPLHWKRRWRRGFNQSALLARQIARRYDLPVSRIVWRKKATAAQAGLTNAKRRDNVRGAFAIRRGVRLDGKRILLVDDVLTTGTTAAACARALKRAGAAHVTVLAVARTDRREFLSYQPEFSVAKAAASGSTS